MLSEARPVNLHASRNRAAQGELPREEMLRDWLGIDNPEPSYYGLLGVPELESDEKAILQAGRTVKRKVRAYQIGIYRKQALGLLAEIGQAVSTLTNPEKRIAYDNSLMGRWRTQAEELARQHVGTGERTPAALEAWLTACRERGIPVTRLMPYLMRRLMARASGWPKVGVHQLPLPIALWTYRDVGALGQTLQVGPFEKRVESVKKAQKLLGIPQGIALLVAAEIAGALRLFSEVRFVRQARDAPSMTLLRLGRRIQRYEGDVAKGKVLAAVARILGKTKQDLDEALAHLDDPPVEMPRGRVGLRAARLARRHVRTLGGRLASAPPAIVDWVADRPQILVPLAVVAGVTALVFAVLIAVGVLHLAQPDEPAGTTGGPGTVPAPTAPATPAVKPPDAPATPVMDWPDTAVRPSEPVTVGAVGPSTGPETAPPETGSDVEPPAADWLEAFRQKYPAGRSLTTPADPTTNVKFFGVKGEKRKNGEPVEQKGPAPKAAP